MLSFLKRGFRFIFRNIGLWFREKKEQLLWLKENNHNKTRMGNYFPRNLVKVGKYTYGELNVHHFEVDGEELTIGNYCSIGPDVEFFLGGEHHPRFLTNYPFGLYIPELVGYGAEDRTSKGPIIVKDDVWIGAHAIILSGVTIGQGAIIGAGSIVAKDVPDYGVYAGGKLHGYRFSEDIVLEMKNIAFDSITKEMIIDHIGDFYTSNVQEVLKKEWIPRKK